MGETVEINSREQLLGLLKEALPELLRSDPSLVIGAMAGNGDVIRKALEDQGFIVSAPIEGDARMSRDVMQAYRAAQDEGRVIRGIGGRIRSMLPTRKYADPNTGVIRNTYLWGESEKLAESWFRAFFSAEKMDLREGSPTFGKSLREIGDALNKATRAPTFTFTGEQGTGGGYLVPIAIAAEIFEETNERFVLRSKIEVFTSASPLRIPRRIAQITVSRGAPQTDIPEANIAATLGAVTITPERVGVLGYVDPQLALAAVVGPVRYTISQFSEALAKDIQRCIVAGDRTVREPMGILSLPTAGQSAYDMAKTATWVDTDNKTRRNSVRALYYKVAQPHRETDRFVFIGNNDMAQKLASLNDTDQQPWKDQTTGASGTTFLGKQFVETSAIATATNQSTLVGGDMGQYAWVESPDGLRLEQTREGGKAWESDSIGVKLVQSFDGSPVIPPAFAQVGSVPV